MTSARAEARLRPPSPPSLPPSPFLFRQELSLHQEQRMAALVKRVLLMSYPDDSPANLLAAHLLTTLAAACTMAGEDIAASDTGDLSAQQPRKQLCSQTAQIQRHSRSAVHDHLLDSGQLERINTQMLLSCPALYLQMLLSHSTLQLEIAFSCSSCYSRCSQA